MSLLEGDKVFSEHINPKALKFNKRSLLVREFQNCDTLNYLVQTEMLRGDVTSTLSKSVLHLNTQKVSALSEWGIVSPILNVLV